jgi:GABA(A) receptor-associated protein
VQQAKHNGTDRCLERCKFLVPDHFTVAEMKAVVRKKISLTSEEALFMFFDGKTLLPATAVLQTIYEEHKQADGMLYVYYSLENTFG